ncbi:hypothetical protein Q9189_005181 [Teloschistes chrysophthalmus]
MRVVFKKGREERREGSGLWNLEKRSAFVSIYSIIEPRKSVAGKTLADGKVDESDVSPMDKSDDKAKDLTCAQMTENG